MIDPIEVTVEIDTPKDAAFDAFVEDIDEWWPLEKLSIAQGTVKIEQDYDGRIVETESDGTEHVWGTITVWDPHDDLAVSWYVGPDRTPTSITLTFVENDEGRTEVTLVHSGWDDLGTEGVEKRSNYEIGWDQIFVQGYAKYARANCPKPMERGTDT